MSVGKEPIKNIDSIYYRDAVSTQSSMNVLVRARRAMFDLFMSQMAPKSSSRILDIGTSDEENEGANFLQKLYPWRENITCVGLGDGTAVKAAYPEVEFLQIEPHRLLPFPDQTFDIACSNAVLEHVGGREQRIFLLKEHLRVARSVFITVPNRWFPIEHHTGLPLLHYSPPMFRTLLRRTRFAHWTSRENLDFISKAQILSEWPKTRAPEISYTGLRLGLFSSNIAIVYHDA